MTLAPGWQRPSLSPTGGFAAGLTRSELAARVCSFELIAVALTQKLAIPLGGGIRNQVALALVLHLGTMAYLAMRGCILVDRTRLAIYTLMLGLLFVTQARFVSSQEWSVTSLLLFSVIYASYTLIVPIERKDYIRIVNAYVTFSLVVGGLVWFNWATQIIGLGLTPNLQTLVPEEFLYREYNYINRLWWGPLQYKPNAIVFLETSHVSQFLAIAIIIEAAFFMRLHRLAFLGVSLLATFGGTGLSILLLTAPFFLPRLKAKAIIGLVVALPVALLFAWQIGIFDNAAKRLSEFDNSSASGNIRFIKPAEAVVDAAQELDTFLFGKGAGAMPKATADLSKTFAWAPYSKVIVEDGFLIFVIWMVLFCMTMFRLDIPVAVPWSLFVHFHLMNGALNVPMHSVYCLLLVGIYRFKEPAPAAEALEQPVAAMSAGRHSRHIK